MNDRIIDFIHQLKTSWEPLKAQILKDVLEKFRSEVDFHSIDFSENEKIDTTVSYGIYYFEIKLTEKMSLSEFKALWQSDAIENQPKVSDKRYIESQPETWQPFYIGKSEKLQDRVHQHIYLDATSTSALKLKRRIKLRKIAKFRFKYYPLIFDENCDNNLIQFVLTNIESEVRSALKPWIGKQ